MAKRKKATSRKRTTKGKGRTKRARTRRGRTAVAEMTDATPTEEHTTLVPPPALPAARPADLELEDPDGASWNAVWMEVAAAPAPRAEERLTQAQIYERLAALLVPYALEMQSEMHPRIGYCLKARSRSTGREAHFGAVQALADGVAFHLFPLYAHPELLAGASPDLFTRMRGQTCFHFEELDPTTLAELTELTRRGFECFLADGMA